MRPAKGEPRHANDTSPPTRPVPTEILAPARTAFLLGLQKAGVKFIAVDMPEANEMMVGIMAVVAEAERKMISERTKAALQAAKARGVKLGNPKGAAAFGDSRDPHKAAAVRSAKSRARAHDFATSSAASRGGHRLRQRHGQRAQSPAGRHRYGWQMDGSQVLNTLARLN